MISTHHDRAFRIKNLERARQAKLQKSRKRRKTLYLQSQKFLIGERVFVVVDHDGHEGRWVGVHAEIIDFDSKNYRFPWVIQSESGARMNASADMLNSTER